MARGSTLNSLLTYGAVGFALAEGAANGLFGQQAQQIGQMVLGALGLPTISASSLGLGRLTEPTAAPSACSASAVQAWSNGVKLPTWVGTLFCSDNGHLPASDDELTTWGKQKGYLLGTVWTPPAGQG